MGNGHTVAAPINAPQGSPGNPAGSSLARLWLECNVGGWCLMTLPHPPPHLPEKYPGLPERCSWVAVVLRWGDSGRRLLMGTPLPGDLETRWRCRALHAQQVQRFFGCPEQGWALRGLAWICRLVGHPQGPVSPGPGWGRGGGVTFLGSFSLT